MTQNPIQKAHLEGVEMFKKNYPYLESGSNSEGNLFIDFLTTYAENLLNAVKEAEESDYEKKQRGMWCDFCGKHHPGQCKKVEEFYDPDMGTFDSEGLLKAHTKSCRSSFHSAIDEGIKEIKKGDI